MPLILASNSPRRRELMRLITHDFTTVDPAVDEAVPDGVGPETTAEMLACRKAIAAAKEFPGEWVVGADTVVEMKGERLGKPQDHEDAKRMLRLLEGKLHHVHTGVCIAGPSGTESFVSSAEVWFAPMSEDEIEEYAASGEGMDKAGAYGIQGSGARFVREIHGDYYTVVGLPVQRLYERLKGKI